ncbi:MAG: transcriptional regulator [Anaerolineaceae bacterium]|nr:transcriptional regulator [Anaerolineaceae bacterium]
MGIRLNNRSERLAKIERMLFRSSHGLRVVEIAEACAVDRRTIYRDLATLEKNGVPITQENGCFLINREYYLANVRLNLNEAVALFLAARAFSRHADKQNPHVISAMNKLALATPQSVSAHIKHIAESGRATPVDRSYVDVLETTIRAWVETRNLKIWSSSTRTGEIAAREFSTYFIEPTLSGGLYAVGFDHLSESVRSLRLEWVRRARLLDTTYKIPDDFDRAPFLASMWGMTSGDTQETRVVLAFSADVTPLIKERIWHTSQRIETLDDKRCTLSMQVVDWHELLPWIRSWGAQVEVLEPLTLRHQLSAEAHQLRQLYTPSTASAQIS